MSATDLGSQLRSPELVEFLHSGQAVVVGNSDGNLVPALTRGFAVRLAPGGETLDVFVGRAQSAVFLTNLRPGGLMAVTVASPPDHRAMQIKGTVVSWQASDDADDAWVEHYWQLFAASVQRVGILPAQSGLLRCRDLVRISLVPTALFRQTPGPAAGSPLDRGTPWS